MKNPILERAIEAAGGMVAVAYKTGRSVTSVYSWRSVGRVPDSRDLVTLYRLAREAGAREVTIEALANVPTPRGTPPKGRGLKTPRGTHGGKMSPEGACSRPIPARSVASAAAPEAATALAA